MKISGNVRGGLAVLALWAFIGLAFYDPIFILIVPFLVASFFIFAMFSGKMF